MSIEPVYLRIADRLELEILRRPSDVALPSENELTEQYGVNRLTARASLQELERRYLVRRAQGKRAEVARRIDYRVNRESPPSWSETIRGAGAVPLWKMQRPTVRKLPAEIRERLELRSGTALSLTRSGYVDGELATWAQTWLPADLAPDFAEDLKNVNSIYAVLSRKYRLEPYTQCARLGYVVASQAIAKRLAQDGRPMVLRVISITASKRLNRPIETTTAYLRADIFNAIIEIGEPA